MAGVRDALADRGKHLRRMKDIDLLRLKLLLMKRSHYMQAWKRGITIITAGSVKVSPIDRFRLVDGYNLEIRDVQTQDAGDYVCQIATLQPQEITHTLEILGLSFTGLSRYCRPLGVLTFRPRHPRRPSRFTSRRGSGTDMEIAKCPGDIYPPLWKTALME
ncbi:unnamed protein product [Nezara viridula]|uniref:Uncharacterized protein n=1 Tax=Nezara viridula TaxID=85310 RepID=A0A9P0H885_NEZVI|nr:unnamed protein product [Nezara viridula]